MEVELLEYLQVIFQCVSSLVKLSKMNMTLLSCFGMIATVEVCLLPPSEQPVKAHCSIILTESEIRLQISHLSPRH